MLKDIDQTSLKTAIIPASRYKIFPLLVLLVSLPLVRFSFLTQPFCVQ
jgi:hypothetical protein